MLSNLAKILTPDRTKGRPMPGAKMWIDQAEKGNWLDFKSLNPKIKKHTEDLIEQGYTIITNSVDHDLCDQAIAEYHDYAKSVSKTDPNFKKDTFGFNTRLVNFHLASKATFKLFSSNQIGMALLDFIYGHPVSVYTSLFFHNGTQQDLHRDTPVFRTEPEDWYFGFWVALEDVDDDNGPLLVVPGGHRTKVQDPKDFALNLFPNLAEMTESELQGKLWHPYQKKIIDNCFSEGLKPIKVPVKKGDTIIWHPSLPHGGSPILDPKRSRLSTVFHVVPFGTPVYQAEVFFKKPLTVPLDRGWRYIKKCGRYYVDFGQPAFMSAL